MTSQLYKLDTTTSGYAAFWEEGGSCRKSGFASITAGPNGERKHAFFKRTSGSLSNGKHVLLPIRPGDYIITQDHGLGNEIQIIYKVERIFKDGDTWYADVKVITHYGNGQWVDPLPSFLEEASQAAYDKAHCYHNRGEIGYSLPPKSFKKRV